MIVVALARCFCQCHSESCIGDAQELRHKGQPASAWIMEMEALERPRGVSTSDYVACVMACERCRQFHKPVLDPMPKASEWVDPPIQPPPKPASGTEGEGEGRE